MAKKKINPADSLKDIKKANDQNSLISRKSKELIDVPSETKTSLLLNKLAIDDLSYTNRGDITSIVGRDKESGLEMSDTIDMILKASTNKINTLSYKRFIRNQVLENRWMIDNMPQLGYGLLLRKTSIFSPDDVNKKSFIYTSPSLNESNSDLLTLDDVTRLLEDEIGFEDLIMNCYDAAARDGFIFIYNITYSELANQLFEFSKNKDAFIKAKGIYEGYYGRELNFDINIMESLTLDEATQTIQGLDADIICEMIDFVDIKEHSTIDSEDKLYETTFPENPWLDSFKDTFKTMLQEHNAIDITEAPSDKNTAIVKPGNVSKQQKSVNFFSNIFGNGTSIPPEIKKNARLNVTGLYTQILDSERVIPVMIGKKVIGIYYIEENDVIGLNKITQTRSLLDKDKSIYALDNTIDKANMVDYLRKVLERNIDTKFIKNNKHILKEIRDILNDSINRDMGVKVRWIPADYLELYTDSPVSDKYTLGKSILQEAKTPIYFYILENKNIQLTEFFYKRPKFIAKINTKGLTTDMEDYVWKSVEALENMYTASNLHNLFDVQTMYNQMGSHGKVILPKDANGNDLIEVERIEGQTTSDNLEVLRMYERHISTIMNTTVSSDEDQYMAYASSYANRNMLAAKVNTENQRHHAKQASRIATNLFRKINNKVGQIDPDIIISYPPAKQLPNTQNNDIISTVSQRAADLAEKLFTEEEVDKKRHYILGYMAKHLKGVEDIKEDFDEIMSSYDKNKAAEDAGVPD